MIMIIATFGQTLCGNGPAVSVIGTLIVWRFIVRVIISTRGEKKALIDIVNRRWVLALAVITPYLPSLRPNSRRRGTVVDS